MRRVSEINGCGDARMPYWVPLPASLGMGTQLSVFVLREDGPIHTGSGGTEVRILYMLQQSDSRIRVVVTL